MSKTFKDSRNAGKIILRTVRKMQKTREYFRRKLKDTYRTDMESTYSTQA